MLKLFLYFIALTAGVLFLGSVARQNGLVGGGPGAGYQLPETLYPVQVTMLKGEPPKAGEPLLLEFWATWCPPCVESVPHLNKIHAKYRKHGLRVVGVTTDTPAQLVPFMARQPISYGIANDPQLAYHNALGVRGIPDAMLIDSEGTIRWRGNPLALTDEDIMLVMK